MNILRDYQSLGLTHIASAYRRGKRAPVFVGPTGMGKTQMFSAMAHGAANKDNRVLILSHRIELVDQISDALTRWEVPHGFIAAGYPTAPAQCMVASVQTLIRRLDTIPEPQLIICDECHHARAKTFETILTHWPRAKIVGFTATPIRNSGESLGKIFDDLIIGPTVQELINGGWLVQPIVFGPETVDTSRLHTRAGDYVASESEQLVNTPSITGSALEMYRKKTNGLPALAFCVSVQHAHDVAKQFRDADYSAMALDGGTDREIRRGVVRDFRDRKITLLASCELFSEGFDCPGVQVGIMLRPTQSEVIYRQQCLDSSTEILTKRGWLKRGEITNADIVAAFDVHENKSEWCPVEEIISRPLADGEEMYAISSPHLDIRVTADHIMIVRSQSPTSIRWIGEYAWKTAIRESMFKIPVAAHSATEDAALSDDEIRFLGWWLTDGTKNKTTNQLIIAQSASKPVHCDEIRRVIAACGLKCSLYIAKRTGQFAAHAPSMNFQISYGMPRGRDKHLRGWKHLEAWIDKSIPSIYETLSDRQIGVLLGAMNLGDGVNSRKTITWVPRTMSITCGDNETMANRLQSILVMRGFRCNQSSIQYPGRARWFYLQINEKHYATVAGTNLRDGMIEGKSYVRSRFERSTRLPAEMVWCVRNRLGTLFTRRNGKVAIIGNCGRILRPEPGKSHAWILDHVNNWERFGLPHWDREQPWSLDGEDTPKKKKATSVKVCPQCWVAMRSEARKCPECGHAFAPKPRVVEQKDGELVELTPEEVAKRQAKRRAAFEQSQATTPEALAEIFRRRGYKGDLVGRARHVLAARAAKKSQTA